MTFHLVGPYLTTTKYTRKKTKSKNAKQRDSLAKHNKWLAQQGLTTNQIQERKKQIGKSNGNVLPDYSTDNPYQLSNSIGLGFKNDIMTNLHKETPEVQALILEKAKRTAPAYSKGAYQYITSTANLSDLGNKK